MDRRNGRGDGPETQVSDVAYHPGKERTPRALRSVLGEARELESAMPAQLSVNLEDHTATASCWLLSVVSCLGAFPCLCVLFLVDNLLRFDRHMYNIGGLGLEPAVCARVSNAT